MKMALVVAGTIFLLVALMHLLRLVYAWEVTIGGHSIPMIASVIGFIVAIVVTFWMFIAASKN